MGSYLPPAKEQLPAVAGTNGGFSFQGTRTTPIWPGGDPDQRSPPPFMGPTPYPTPDPLPPPHPTCTHGYPLPMTPPPPTWTTTTTLQDH